MVFDHLKYLPSEIFWRIIKRAVYQDKLPAFSGDLVDILLWEKWDVKESKENNNTNYVEPDVFLRYLEFDIIVEAKRYNQNQQSSDQMREQIHGYYYNFVDENKELYYVQLGGLFNKGDSPNFKFTPYSLEKDEQPSLQEKTVRVLKADWDSILNSIVDEQKFLDAIPYSQMSNYNRLLKDIINGFELFQFYRISWLADLKPKSNSFTDFNTYFNYAK